MKQTIDAYTLYPAGALQHMSTCLPSILTPVRWIGISAVLHASSTEYERLDSAFCTSICCMHVQFLIRQGKLLQSGRREADPNIISAGQFPPARPEQDSPHLRVNASPSKVDSGSGFPTTSAWSCAFFSFFFCGLILFSLFRYSHHLAENAANW